MNFNLHTHTHFSDGSSEPLKYFEEAVRQEFHTLGFSDHSPLPFDNTFALKEEMMQEYIQTIKSLSTQLDPHPTILVGLEIDYIPGISKPIQEYREMGCFDYFIGAVHLVKNLESSDLWFIDGPDITIYDEGLKRVFGGDIKRAVTSYFHQVNSMLVTQKPDILGHMDKIKMYNRNRYFREDEKWYLDLVDETLALVKQTGAVIEVNTRGIYKKRSESLFPGEEILGKIRTLDIPVIISSDAHKPEELSYGFDEAKKVLIGQGFSHIAMKTISGWENVALTSF